MITKQEALDNLVQKVREYILECEKCKQGEIKWPTELCRALSILDNNVECSKAEMDMAILLVEFEAAQKAQLDLLARLKKAYDEVASLKETVEECASRSRTAAR